MKFEFAVYDPPEKGMPYLAVRIEGVKTNMKKVTAIATKTHAEAQTIVEGLAKDLQDPHWRARELLSARFSAKQSRTD